MADTHDPMRRLHQQAEAAFTRYGGESGVDLVETFGEIEAEYAAIRKGCALLDQPQRATLEVLGRDRLAFLNRMLTQDLGPERFPPLRCARSFWLNRRGRIDADLRVLSLGPAESDRLLLDVDILAADHCAASLSAYIFTEDVRIETRTASFRRLALHGPTASALIASLFEPLAGANSADLAPGAVAVGRLAGVEVVMDRQDSTGEPGFELLVPADAAERIWQTLVEAGAEDHDNGAARRFRLRAAGWRAYNIARLEAGWPIFNIDFGPENLPHETGILRDRVSFTKGCYLGQEVVARMEHLGHPKQILVGLRVEPAAPDAQPIPAPLHPDLRLSPNTPRQPAAGAPLFDESAPDSDPVGAVTSSALSPMLGDAPICLAQIKHKHAAPGSRLLVATDAGRIPALVQDGLAFLRR